MSESRELTNYDAKLAEQAQAYAQQHQLSGGTFLSTKSGVLKYGEETMPGNEAIVVILDSVIEHTYYEGKYAEGDKTPPRCYAFGRDPTDMAPHESMAAHLEYFQPQNDECRGCPKNEWGSADTGRGKACQNRIRLALIPAGVNTPKKGSRDFDLELFADPADFANSDVAFLKLPVTSGKNYAKYVSQLSAMHRLPPHGVVTRISLTPHEQYQYLVNFEMVEKLPAEILAVVMPRNEEVTNAPIQGYSPPSDEPETRGSLKGLRR